MFYKCNVNATWACIAKRVCVCVKKLFTFPFFVWERVYVWVLFNKEISVERQSGLNVCTNRVLFVCVCFANQT